jgi:hypothetical protein
MAGKDTATKTPEVLRPHRVIRVSPDFGIYNPGDTRFFMATQTPFDEAEMLEVFQKNGYVVARGGSFDSYNPMELGIDIQEFEAKEIAHSLGLEMPRSTPLMEVMTIDSPVVAKALYADRGEHKYLLESQEQKARFVAWLVGGSHFIIQEPNLEKARGKLMEYLDRARSGLITKEEFEIADKNWAFEEFVTTPSDFNTSYRVVADGYGNIHYAQLHRSQERRGTKKIQAWDNDDRLPLFEYSLVGDDYGTLLVHPRSPLFLDSVEIVSNIARGGERILLDGKPVEGEVNRQVLSDHGIDPNNSNPPAYVLEKSAEVGKLVRTSYPYTGVDWIQDKLGSFKFLEANNSPALNSSALGLSDSSTGQERILEMIRRIVAGSVR